MAEVYFKTCNFRSHNYRFTYLGKHMHTCLNIFFSHCLVFNRIFKQLVQKIWGKMPKISQKPPYNILRAETWKNFIFYHNEYLYEISAKSEHPSWRWLYIWREITHKWFEYFETLGLAQYFNFKKLLKIHYCTLCNTVR